MIQQLGGGFKHLLFLPPPGEMIQFDLRRYFSNGLVQPQPPTRQVQLTDVSGRLGLPVFSNLLLDASHRMGRTLVRFGRCGRCGELR